MTCRRLLLTAAATSLMLAACNPKPAGPVTGAPIASLPLADAAPPPEVAAPAASDLPPAPPIRRISTPRQPVYSYIDDAYDLGDAFADSPPDYTVDYEGVQPWIWRTSGGDYRVVEQTPYGEREYFYHAGSDYPFLIRDHDYSYAYDDGQLVEVYDSYGRPYPNYGQSLLVIAAQYLFRGQHLHYAAIHDQRQAAYASDWRARQGGVMAAQQRWSSEQQSNPDWRRFHDQHVQQQQPRQASFQQDRTQRQAYAQRIAPVIAAAPQAPPPRQAPPAADRRQFAQDRGGTPNAGSPGSPPQQVPGGDRGQQRAQAEAANPARPDLQRQQQAQQQGQARDQQRAQAEAAHRGGEAAPRQQQAQAQAQNQQREQAQAANQARKEVQRQQQGANRAQAEVARQAQAQAAARSAPAQAMAQQHQAQAQAAVQQHQMAAQHAQAAQVQHAQAAAQHASPAAAHPPAKPDEQKK